MGSVHTSKEQCKFPGDFYVDSDVSSQFPIFGGLVQYRHTTFVNDQVGFLKNFHIDPKIFFFLDLLDKGQISIEDPVLAADLGKYKQYVLTP